MRPGAPQGLRGTHVDPAEKKKTGMERLDRITVDVARMNGEPCIRDLRLTVRRVLEALAAYPTSPNSSANTLNSRTRIFGKRLPSPLLW